jgi:hypothetical protein
MRSYEIFGGCLRSALEFSDLAPSARDRATWTLRVGPAPARATLGLLGTDVVHDGCSVRLLADDAGYRLAYDDTGTFDISADGAVITWAPAAAASPDDARLDVIGRVLALALHAQGVLCLHGSAVALGEGGVAFLAPKHSGKSTLACALTSAGARFLGDDTLPVELPVASAPAVLRPGVHQARLWDDAARHLAADVEHPADGVKHVVPLAAPPAATPLRAIYLLAPVPPDRAAVRRAPLAPVPAAVSLVRHAKLGPLLGGRAAPALFDAAVAVARATPVYVLEVARDFARLREVVERLLAWHGGSAEDLVPAGRDPLAVPESVG